ncbi:hypothetical protein DFH06DRAFT_601747 [Mycena polygramma]|nr:hypothetical protein DFH06DRAFT_601747 [Mycena polygramma]
MNSSCILPACLPVQEVWDYIIDHLQHSKQDLRSCSVTCWSFVPRTQAHLFRSISICTKGPKTAESAATELVSITHKHPHLLAYIRRLSVVSSSQTILAHLCRLAWSRLEDLTLTYREHSGAEAMYEFLTRSPRLEVVRIISVDPHLTPLHPPFDVTSAVSSPRGKPRRLILIDSDAMFGVLSHPSFPLDFSALTHIHCPGCTSSTELAAFVFRHRSMIESLDLGIMGAGIQSLNLGLFPVLKHVSCAFIGVELNQILKSLGPDNTVDTIRAGLDGPNYVRDLADFQRTINALKMPALRRVELQVLFPAAISPESKVSRERAFESVVERELPDIKARGQLFVSFN